VLKWNAMTNMPGDIAETSVADFFIAKIWSGELITLTTIESEKQQPNFA